MEGTESQPVEQVQNNTIERISKRGRVNEGAPSLFHPMMIEQIENYEFKRGATITEICELLGVHYRKVYDWMEAYPEFKQAVAWARTMSDCNVESGLYRRATGTVIVEQKPNGKWGIVDCKRELPPDTDAALNWLYNRQPDRWSRRQDVNLSGSITATFNVSLGQDKDKAIDVTPLTTEPTPSK